MSEKFRRRWEGASIWVILFGIFVCVSLFVQCLIPFLGKLVELNGYDYWWLSFLNDKFILPMDIISDFWAAISAAYIGVDRAAMTISTINGEYNHIDSGHPEHNRHIIIESFIIYVIAVLLNMVFDTELSLTPLAVSLCSSVLLYVSGQKAIYAASKVAPEHDKDNNGIDDRAEEILRDLTEKKVRYVIATYLPNGKLKKEIEIENK